jgi:hypothetical protein
MKKFYRVRKVDEERFDKTLKFKDKQSDATAEVQGELPKNALNYSILQDVFNKAFHQAANGKGKERHAGNVIFLDQPIFWIEKYFKSFQLGQAAKKMHESQDMEPDAAATELLGAINYLAAKIISLRQEQ